MSNSTILLNYTGQNLEFYIESKESITVIQVLPISEYRINVRTGVDTRDYLLIYEQNER